MTEHDKLEHTLPNGDILIVDATRIPSDVTDGFEKVKADLLEQARATYRRLQGAPAPA